MSISKEEIGIDEFTNAEDQELIEFTKNLSINELKTETISLRVSKVCFFIVSGKPSVPWFIDTILFFVPVPFDLK